MLTMKQLCQKATLFYGLMVLYGANLGAQEFQLAAAQWQAYSPFFTNVAKAELKFEMPGSSVHYTLDGTNPTAQSTLYEHPLHIQKSSVLKVISVHPDFRPSEVVSFPLIRINKKRQPKTLKLLQMPSPKYPGHGAATLMDLQKGSLHLQDFSWIGFEGTDAELLLELPRRNRHKQLTVSCLSLIGSWIFRPKSIVLQGSMNGTDFFPLANWTQAISEDKPADGQVFISLPIADNKVRWIKAVIQNQGKLPTWHPGAGQAAWLFIDELFID